MMNRFIYLFLLSGCAASASVGCTADPEVEPLLPAGGDGRSSWVSIEFCDNSFDEIDFRTRATLDNVAESRVSNLFVYLFNDRGERVYGSYFDAKNRMDSESELQNAEVDSWWVQNASKGATRGTLRIFAPAISDSDPDDGESPELYILTNINADMVNISPDKLNFVRTRADLEAMTVRLNQEITERNGFFPMTGSAPDIAVGGGSITSGGQKDFKVSLTRLDAKIGVKVRVAKGYMDSLTSTAGDETGGAPVTTTHKIDSFVPLSWQVVNLPRTAFVLPHPADAESEMFSTRETKFETREPDKVSYTHREKDENGVLQYVNKVDVPTEAHGFSFYMLENRHAPKKEIRSDTEIPENKRTYHLRDTRAKDEDGVYEPDADGTGDIWKYAPAGGTYLVLRGEVLMALEVDNQGKNQQLSADVVYYIHLGNFGGDNGSIDDYNVLRNHSYTYTITIYGVDNIQVEVQTKTTENESGATGHVYVAKESIFTFDSHFGSTVVAFDEGHITDIENLLWYVKTPFGREGKPYVIGGIEVPSGLDYRWVHFVVNKRDEEDKYLKSHAPYNPEEVKDILAFSKYIKEQKTKFIEDKSDGHIDNDSEFRPEVDDDWKAKFPQQEELWTRYRIYVTIFVDEFYYTANPITGDKRQDLWKEFVNRPNRIMHILCDADQSADEASRTTGSVITIRQRSIQTVFNTQKPELMTAWGCETIDETRDGLWYYSRGERYVQDPNRPKGYMVWQRPPGTTGTSDEIPSKDGNNSKSNGLYNTAKIWGLFDRNNNLQRISWDEYVDYDRPSFLYNDDKKETLRYSCLTRNRDENGNGYIDAAEVKWYLASINQLASLYVGDQGLSSDAVLYPYYKQKITSNELDAKNAYTWRAHIVSSTATDTGWPEILWAEEGLSTGSYEETYGKSAGLTVRCVRNLGMDAASEEEAQENLRDESYVSEMEIQMSGPDDNDVDDSSVYRFDMTNMNPLSIRYYSSQELEPRNEHSVEARVYWAFETGPMTGERYSYDSLHNLIREGKSPCPEGYRTPNVREGALMSLFCPKNWLNEEAVRVSTYYSHGLRGTAQDLSNSWLFNGTRIFLDGGDKLRIRCVKDIRQ